MDMLVQPAPLPEEMDRGYLGRILRINRYRSPKEMVEAIATHFGEDGRSRRELTTHELLSRMAGMTTEHFAQRHTTLPLRRGITSYFPELVHGSAGRRSLLCISGTLRKYPAAFLCKECVRADIDFHGTSYWRRDLQTPGQMWCPKHLTPLHFVSSADPFIASPAMLMEDAHQMPEEWVKPAIGNAYVQRFLEMAAALYDRTAPLSVALVAPLLRDMGRAQGFKANAGSKQGALISDRVRELFPEHWLSAVFHEVVAKSHGVYLHQVDGTLYLRTAASSVIAYLLVLSVMFESADQAINTMASACSGAVTPDPRLRSARRQVPDAGELMERYVQAKGVHADVARLLGLATHTVRKALGEMGLPSLPAFDAASQGGVVAALRAYYLDRRPHSTCMKMSGIPENRFDALVRQCGPKLATALDLMSPKTKSRPKARQAKGLLPHQRQATAAALSKSQLREILLQN